MACCTYIVPTVFINYRYINIFLYKCIEYCLFFLSAVVFYYRRYKFVNNFVGRQIEPYGVDYILQRLGFSHAKTTIPKWLQVGCHPQTSHNIDCVLGSLSAIYGPCSVWIGVWQRSSPVKGELAVGRGPNSISKFDHHNINGGAVSTIHEVTGRRLVSSI
jgi:hypothetical protein